ncbi:MAG: hypothetical protein ACUVSX_00450 [Aggregatilineales bacterium]
MAENTNRLERIPVVKWAAQRPRLAAWLVLSLGMVVLLVIEARDVGLLPTQWAALVIACVLVAGACVWIISWEDSDETAPLGAPADSGETPPSDKAE